MSDLRLMGRPMQAGSFWDRLRQAGILAAEEQAAARTRHTAAGGAVDTAILETRLLPEAERRRLEALVAETLGWPVSPSGALAHPQKEALSLLEAEWVKAAGVVPFARHEDTLDVAAAATAAPHLAALSAKVGLKLRPHFALEVDIRRAQAHLLSVPLSPRFFTLSARLAESDTQPPGLGVVLTPDLAWEADTPAGLLVEAGQGLSVFLLLVPKDEWLSLGFVAGVDPTRLEGLKVERGPHSILGRCLTLGSARVGPVKGDRGLELLFEGLGQRLPSHILVEPIRAGARILAVFVGGRETPIQTPDAVSARRVLARVGRLLDRPGALERLSLNPGVRAPKAVEINHPAPSALGPLSLEPIPSLIPHSPEPEARELGAERASGAWPALGTRPLPMVRATEAPAPTLPGLPVVPPEPIEAPAPVIQGESVSGPVIQAPVIQAPEPPLELRAPQRVIEPSTDAPSGRVVQILRHARPVPVHATQETPTDGLAEAVLDDVPDPRTRPQRPTEPYLSTATEEARTKAGRHPAEPLRNRSEECRDESRTRPQRPTEPYLSTATEEARTKAGRHPAEPLRSTAEALPRVISRVITLAPPDEDSLAEVAPVRATRPPAPPNADELKRALTQLASREPAERERAQELLVGAGEEGLTALLGVFPGFVLVDRYSPDAVDVPVERHSAVLECLLRFGDSAAVALEPLCDHLSPEFRFYATFAFTALPLRTELRAIAPRLFDKDPLVREVAVRVVDRHRSTQAFDAVVAQLRRALRAVQTQPRRLAIAHLGRLRAAAAVLELVDTLSQRDLAEGAHRALTEITCQDFGLETWQWEAWFERNREKPRGEWLVAGLASGQRAIRAAAFKELAKLAGRTFAYSVDGTPESRKKAIELWRQWWQTEGSAHFR